MYPTSIEKNLYMKLSGIQLFGADEFFFVAKNVFRYLKGQDPFKKSNSSEQ